jgi:Glycosyl transferase family 2
MARGAYAALRESLPLSRSVERLVESAEGIVSRRRRAPAPVEAPLPELLVTPLDAEAPAAEQRYPEVTSDPDSADLRAALKESRLDFVELRRELERWRRESREGTLPVVAIDRASRAYAAAKPRVSVITPLYNYGGHIETALASVVRGDYADLELVVVEDGSTDDSLEAARRFIAEHEGVPTVLVRHPINRGLGAARNTGVDFARGEFCFMLDADNELYRHALGRLVARLDETPDAAAAYGMLERFSTAGPEALMSVFPWRVDRFRTGNYIDAMALWRRRELQHLGAYTTDRRLYGWEDFDLWCRLAESGGRAELVQEIIARYRVTRHSMLTLTNISARAAVSVLIERYPRVMAGVVPPAA